MTEVNHGLWHERLKAWAAFSNSYLGPDGTERHGEPEERIAYRDDDAMLIDRLMCRLGAQAGESSFLRYAVWIYYLRRWYRDDVPGTQNLAGALYRSHGYEWRKWQQGVSRHGMTREQCADAALVAAIERLDLLEREFGRGLTQPLARRTMGTV